MALRNTVDIMPAAPIIRASALTRGLPAAGAPDRQGLSRRADRSAPAQRHLILSGLNLAVDTGEAVAIVGPSGTGKSTLLHILNGLLQPESGRLEVFGQDTAQLSENGWATWRRTRIATIFQDANLIPTMKLQRNVAFRANLAGCHDPLREQKIMQTLGIAHLGGRYPDQVSGGERQRAAIAAAFAMRPQLLLADEPTGSLDEASAQRVAELLFTGIRDRSLTAVVATHNLALAKQCDRVLELSGGTLQSVYPAMVQR